MILGSENIQISNNYDINNKNNNDNYAKEYYNSSNRNAYNPASNMTFFDGMKKILWKYGFE